MSRPELDRLRWRRGRSRGYSLVEVAIVLTAFLLVAGGMVYPLSNRWNDEQYASTERLMEIVQRAIINYAASHRTDGHELVFVWQPNTQTAEVNIPSGRPYLPCPDLDGDGLEDRVDVSPAARVDIHTERRGITPYFVAAWDTKPGRCIDSKGMVPYRTLNVPANDVWGNHITYWVERNLSNRMLGFDQLTKGNRLFKYGVTPLPFGSPAASSGQFYAYMINLSTNTTGAGRIGEFGAGGGGLIHYFPNGIILDDNGDIVAGDHICTNAAATRRWAAAAVSVSSNWPACSGGTPALPPTTDIRSLSNATATRITVIENASLPDTWATDDPQHMLDGVGFVLVSHGRNGWGAARHLPGDEDDNAFTCARAPSNAAEIANARRTTPCTEKMSHPRFRPGGTAAKTETYNLDACALTNCLNLNGVFYLPAVRGGAQAGEDDEANDDIVKWMNTNQIIMELVERGVLPVEPPPVAVVQP